MPKDPLCPLGFHPQVRWPTRCKRCFREYKEHAPKKEETDRTNIRNELESESRRERLTSQNSSSFSSSFSTSFDAGDESVSRYRSSPSSSSTAEEEEEKKDTSRFRTPYSSISSEALNSSMYDYSRLNRLREERKAAPVISATTETLALPTPESDVSLRRRTTDLSNIDINLPVEPIKRDRSLSPRPSSITPTPTVEPAAVKEKPVDSVKEKVPEKKTIGTVGATKPPIVKKLDNLGKTPSTPIAPLATPEESVTFRITKKSPLLPKKTLGDVGNFKKEISRETSPIPPPRSKTPTPPDSPSGSGGSDGDSPIFRRKEEDVTQPAKTKKPKRKRLLIQGVQEVVPQPSVDSDPENYEGGESADVAFIIQVKSTRKKKNRDDDDETMSMTTTTDTTETTLVDVNESNSSGISSWEYEEMKTEVERLREKCDKLEKEKAEILSRRVANLEAPKAQSSEYLKIQQKVNQLTTVNEDLKDEQKHLEIKIRELENELAVRPSAELTQRTVADLRTKLSSAEALVEQLNEEKREAVQQMNDMQEEFEEMQDGFREEQSEEFASIKKELDEATKNCRLLQFKLRKTEKRADQLEAEKKELETRVENSPSGKVAKLEEELAKTKAENEKLLKASSSLSTGKPEGGSSPGLKKKSPVLTKAPSGEKVDPPIFSDVDSGQLLRDLQSTLERESDLREQLKFTEEEVTSMRQKISRIEDENESLLIQIKKMSTKPKLDLIKGKDGGKVNGAQIAEKADVSDLKIQLDLNEQESKILRRKVEELENSNSKLTKDLQKAEEKFQTHTNSPAYTKSKSVDEVSILRRKLIEKEREIERLETELLAVASKNKGKMTRAKSNEVLLDDASKKAETEAKAELKKVQAELKKAKEEAAAQRNQLDDELARSKKDLDSQQSQIVQMGVLNQNLLDQLEKFNREVGTMKDHYETIQDDFVIKNSHLDSQKEEAERNLVLLKKEYDTIENELKALRETFNTRHDAWIIEKLSMQDKIRELDSETMRMKMIIPGEKESVLLKAQIKEQVKELDVKKQEILTYKDQILFMQKESDELRRQLEDFEKVSQVQMRSLVSENPKSELELKTMKEKLQVLEKSHKTELAQLKLRQDQHAAMKAEEISSLQANLSRSKRERDMFRQMVDSAQRAIAELKSRDQFESPNSVRKNSISSGFEEAATGARAAVISLQERVSSLEDDLTDARRETSRTKTEMATEKSTWELKLGEMQQKINELEEDRLLGSGRSRAAGQRTRLELAWQKEREEQQRRLKEATTLARDLKTTLLEIERERDREKSENKRRQDQIKFSLDEEQEELRRKVSESHNDLLELRDAHAKLRTANEKLRRDREKLEKDRETQLKKELEAKRLQQEREVLLGQLIGKLSALPPSAPSTPGGKINTGEVLHYLQNIRELKQTEDLLNPKEKRRSNFRRAASAGETDDGASLLQSQESLASVGSSSYYGKEHYGAAGARKAIRYGGSSSTLTLPSKPRIGLSSGNGSRSNMSDAGGQSANSSTGYNPRGSLYRKSLSLEQTVAMPDEQRIWKGESETGSGSSLKSITSMDGQLSRGSSIDRMSTISTKSEKPKSQSLVGKMKKLVKSKSIEEKTPTAESLVKAGVQAAGVASTTGSDLSLNSESERGRDPVKGIKAKVKGIFKRSGRSPSTERKSSQPPTLPSTSSPSPVQIGSGVKPLTASSRSSRESTPKRESTQRPLMPSNMTLR